MTPVVLIAVAAATVWLLALTVALMLCVRQLGALTVRMELIARGAGGHAHGAMVGFQLSDELLERAPFLAEGTRAVLLLSGSCSTCAKLIGELETQGRPDRLSTPDELVILHVRERGSKEEPALGTIRSIGRVIDEPDSTNLARSLRLANLPSALLIEDGHITATLAFIDHVSQIDDMLGGSMQLTPSGNGVPSVVVNS
jgi:hypothetical protein